MKFSIKIPFLFLVLVTGLSGLYSQPINVKISSISGKTEPSICINPNNPNEVVVGTNLKSVYRSSDGGRTWTSGKMNSTFGVWGDPVIACDTAGDFYFFHLSNPPFGSWIDRMVCQKSKDVGKTWSDGSDVGKSGSKAQDKEWVSIDPKTNIIYMTWTQFDKYGSRDDTLYSNILFSKSEDAGITWETPLQINAISGDCIDSSLTNEGAVPAVGPNGEVYVSWAGPAGLVFDKSLDGGETWMKKDILVDSFKTGWTYDIPGISRCNGMPITVCDLSVGENNGTIYVNWSDQRNGKDDTDIWLRKSEDGGNTWSKPKRVNDDTTKTQQFLTWMTIDQSTGFLYFIWYDRRNYEDTKTDVYMAVSYDGGETFVNGILSEKPFDPSKGVFFGDYTNISAVKGNVRPIWAAMNNDKTEIWTALYTEQNTKVAVVENYNWAVDSYPNPFQSEVNIVFTLSNPQKVKIGLYDLNGSRIGWIRKKKKLKAGEQKITFQASEFELVPGTYLYLLDCKDFVIRKKLVFAP